MKAVSASQTQVVVRGNRDRGSLSIRGRTVIERVPQRPIYELLVDPRTHTRWIPGLKSVRVHPSRAGVVFLDEVHEINFLAFGHSFNTRLAMKPDAANARVTFDLVSSDLYRAYTTTFITQPGSALCSPPPLSFSSSSSSSSTPRDQQHSRSRPSLHPPPSLSQAASSTRMQPEYTEAHASPAAVQDPSDPRDLDTIVLLEGELALKMSPPGPFSDMLVQSLQAELTTTLNNLALEARKQ